MINSRRINSESQQTPAEREVMEQEVLELSRDQILTRIERGAKMRGLLYSAPELISRYREGRLDDPSAVGDLIAMTSLLPDDDPLFVRP